MKNIKCNPVEGAMYGNFHLYYLLYNLLFFNKYKAFPRIILSAKA